MPNDVQRKVNGSTWWLVIGLGVKQNYQIYYLAKYNKHLKNVCTFWLSNLNSGIYPQKISPILSSHMPWIYLAWCLLSYSKIIKNKMFSYKQLKLKKILTDSINSILVETRVINISNQNVYLILINTK